MEAAQALKEKKTRGIALKDVSRLDTKISELKSAIASQEARKARLELMVPTFAAGGPSSGYQMGAGHGTSDNIPVYFPAAGRSGYVSPTEYILDAQTTSNIGVRNLDVMRATKGQSFNSMRKQMTVPRMASGGTFMGQVNADGSVSNAQGAKSGPVTLEVSMQVGISEQEFVRVISATMKNHDGSPEQINAILKSYKDGGDNPLLRFTADYVNKNK